MLHPELMAIAIITLQSESEDVATTGVPTYYSYYS